MKKYRDAIICCPTKEKSIAEWEKFKNVFSPVVESSNRSKLSICLKNGQRLIFMNSHNGRKKYISKDFLVFDDIMLFKGMLKAALDGAKKA